MPIIALILSTLGFWALFWFVRLGGLRHLQEQSARRKEEARQAVVRTAFGDGPLRTVDDPRDAAIILMLVLARGDGDVTSAQAAAVENVARAHFECEDDWVGRMTQARFMAGHAKRFDQAADAFIDLFHSRLTRDERHELVAMLRQVAPERPSALEYAAVIAFKRQLGIASA